MGPFSPNTDADTMGFSPPEQGEEVVVHGLAASSSTAPGYGPVTREANNRTKFPLSLLTNWFPLTIKEQFGSITDQDGTGMNICLAFYTLLYLTILWLPKHAILIFSKYAFYFTPLYPFPPPKKKDKNIFIFLVKGRVSSGCSSFLILIFIIHRILKVR